MTVLLFARARDLVGASSIEVELPTSSTVADLRRYLGATWPHLAPFLEHCALAVDDEIASAETPLSTDAVVALLPPVSGG